MDPKVIPLESRVRARRGHFAGMVGVVKGYDHVTGQPRVMIEEPHTFEGWPTIHALDLDVIPPEPAPPRFAPGQPVRVEGKRDGEVLFGGPERWYVMFRSGAISWVEGFGDGDVDPVPPVTLDPREFQPGDWVEVGRGRIQIIGPSSEFLDAWDVRYPGGVVGAIGRDYVRNCGKLIDPPVTLDPREPEAVAMVAPKAAPTLEDVAAGAFRWQQQEPRDRRVHAGVCGHVATVTATVSPFSEGRVVRFFRPFPPDAVACFVEAAVLARRSEPTDIGVMAIDGEGEDGP